MVCQLAAQQGQAVTCLRIDRELRRGRDYVRVVIVATAEAADVAEALGVTWQAVLTAAGDDPAGWDLGGAEAEVQPAYPLGVPVPPRPAATACPCVPGTVPAMTAALERLLAEARRGVGQQQQEGEDRAHLRRVQQHRRHAHVHRQVAIGNLAAGEMPKPTAGAIGENV